MRIRLYLPSPNMRHLVILLCIGVVLMGSKATAQLNNSYFFNKSAQLKAGQAAVSVDNLFYFRNLEYKTHIDEGRTLFGYQLWPTLSYQVADDIRVTGGGFFQKDFGADGFYHHQPTLTLEYRTGKKVFRLGTLNGSVQHNLVEPLYDFERVIEQRVENGFQFLWNKPRFTLDAWIDWRMVSYPNGTDPERFFIGTVAEPKWIKREHIQFSTPYQMVIYHQGGEIDTSGMPTLSQFNFDYAGRLTIKPEGALDSIDVQAHFLYYEDISTNTVSFIDGLGQYLSIAAYRKNWGMMLNYYDAHQFQAPLGDVLFQSVSAKNPALYTRFYRKMVMARLFYERDLGSDLRFLFRAGYMRDLNQPTDNVIGEFYFRWTPSFHLTKPNK